MPERSNCYTSSCIIYPFFVFFQVEKNGVLISRPEISGPRSERRELQFSRSRHVSIFTVRVSDPAAGFHQRKIEVAHLE